MVPYFRKRLYFSYVPTFLKCRSFEQKQNVHIFENIIFEKKSVCIYIT
jgi:hypothetical protein